MENEIHQESEHKTNCSGCGANLVFEPGSNHLTCDYCGAKNAIDDVKVIDEKRAEIDLEKYLENFEELSEKIEIKLVKCNSCGASSSFKSELVSDSCAFCNTPLIIKQAETCNTIKPSFLLPFRVNQKRAHEEFVLLIKSLWFAPNNLKKYVQLNEKLKGMYLPFWTYDASSFSRYTGQRGTEYQVSVSRTDSKGKRYTAYETRVRWTSVSGNLDHNFDDVLVSGSVSLPREKQHSLEPWDLENLVEYDKRYLLGFQTEQYQLGLKEGYAEARVIMDGRIRSLVCQKIGGDRQRINSLHTSFSKATFKHILLPTWLSAFNYGDKVYQILINARTGEVQGERPWSKWKIFFASLAGLLALLAAAYVHSQMN